MDIDKISQVLSMWYQIDNLYTSYVTEIDKVRLISFLSQLYMWFQIRNSVIHKLWTEIGKIFQFSLLSNVYVFSN